MNEYVGSKDSSCKVRREREIGVTEDAWKVGLER